MAPFWQSLLSPPKFSVATMSTLHAQLERAHPVGERSSQPLIDALRTTAELVLWGDQNEPELFEAFLEKNVLGQFWRLLEGRETPSSVKVQILQTLSILISNIEAGPSIYYILSNDHINELIRHPFDFSNEELLAHYVSLLKAIALRLDEHTVQFFISGAEPAHGEREYQSTGARADSASSTAVGDLPMAGASTSSTPPPTLSSLPSDSDGDSPPPPARFALFEAALTLWTHEERMVRTAVRTIVLAVCKLAESRVQAFISSSRVLPQVVVAALCAEHARVGRALISCGLGSLGSADLRDDESGDARIGSSSRRPSSSERGVAAPPVSISMVDEALQGLLDEIYFVNDLLEESRPPLAASLVSALLAGFVLPFMAKPLVPEAELGGCQGPSSVNVDSKQRRLVDAVRSSSICLGASAPESSDDRANSSAARIWEMLSLLLMATLMSTLSHAPLLNVLATLFLHPSLELSAISTPIGAPCVLPLYDEHAHEASLQDVPSARHARKEDVTCIKDGHNVAVSELAVASCTWRRAADGAQAVEAGTRIRRVARNDLRAALFSRLESDDEREILLSSACILAAIRSPAVHSDTLRQANLLPVRRLRASCLLERLLATRTPEPECTEASRPSRDAAAATTPAGRPDVTGTPSRALHTNSSITEADVCEYSEEAVVAMLNVLARAVVQPIDVPETSSPAALPLDSGGASTRGASDREARSIAPVRRLVVVQIVIELLLELLGGAQGGAPLLSRHSAMIDRTHADAAVVICRTLNGPYASEIGNLAEYEYAQLPRAWQESGSTLRLSAVLADPSLLLPVTAIPQMPLARRHARNDLEAVRVALQTFLLVRRVRYALRSEPDDLDILAPPSPPDLRRDVRIHLDKSSQLLPCELRLPSRPTDLPLKCRLVLPMLETTGGSSDPTMSWAKRGFLLLVTLPTLGELPPPPPPLQPPPPLVSSAMGNGRSATANRSGKVSPLAPASVSVTSATPQVVKQASVLLALPLSALRVERSDPAAASLSIILTRPLTARDGCGIHPHGQSGVELGFGEPWRASIAKAHLERASGSLRIDQRRRLEALLGEVAPSSC